MGLARFGMALGLWVAGCRSSEPSQPADAAPAASPIAAASPSPSASAPPIDARPLADAYSGMIGDKSRVVMRLHPAADAGADGVEGEYFYEAVGDGLALEGTFSPTGQLALTERARDGKVTGTFSGDRFASGAIGGIWTAAGGGHELPFALTPVAREATQGPVRVFTRAFRNRSAASEVPAPSGDEKPPSTCDMKIRYPEVFGLPDAKAEAAINKALNAEDERACEQPCEGERSFEVTFNRSGVLSVDVTGSRTCWTAAHPSNNEGFSANFLVATGEDLALERVFKKPFATAAAKLFKPAVDRMMKELYANGGGPQPDDDGLRDLIMSAFEAPAFVFVDGGVRFSVARSLPHVYQPLEEKPTKLTFAQLAPALDPRSPVAFLWKH
jgi:hypothetical protein